ncbi:MAG: hypothetical protein AAF705_05230, partial [Bacteroidota bacterium]
KLQTHQERIKTAYYLPPTSPFYLHRKDSTLFNPHRATFNRGFRAGLYEPLEALVIVSSF